MPYGLELPTGEHEFYFPIDSLATLSTIPGCVDSSAMGIFSWPHSTPLSSGIFGRSTTRQPYVQVACEEQWLLDTDNPNQTYVSFPTINPELVGITWALLMELVQNDTASAGANSSMTEWRAPPAGAANHSLLMLEGVSATSTTRLEEHSPLQMPASSTPCGQRPS